MSRELKFYGASDDLFEIEGTTGGEPDEIGCYSRPVAVEVVDVNDGEEEGVRVVAQYGLFDGLWMIGVEPLAEDVTIPPWPASINLSDRGYSSALTLTVPDSAKVRAFPSDPA